MWGCFTKIPSEFNVVVIILIVYTPVLVRRVY